MTFPYSSDNNDELIAEAIRERTFLDLQVNMSDLPRRGLDARRHPSFSQALTQAQDFKGEVVTPKVFKYEDILDAMRDASPVVFKYQWGFSYDVINDETKFGSNDEYYSGGNKGYFVDKEEADDQGTPRSLLVQVTEHIVEEKITIVELKMLGHEYDSNKGANTVIVAERFPFTFVGMAKKFGGTYGYSVNATYFCIEVDKLGAAICIPLGENQQGKPKGL